MCTYVIGQGHFCYAAILGITLCYVYSIGTSLVRHSFCDAPRTFVPIDVNCVVTLQLASRDGRKRVFCCCNGMLCSGRVFKQKWRKITFYRSPTENKCRQRCDSA